MKKVSTLLASLPLITTACGGGSSDGGGEEFPNETSIDLTRFKGIWENADSQTTTSPSGTTFSFQPSTAIVTSDLHLLILTGGAELFVLEPNSTKAHYFKTFDYSSEITATAYLDQGNFDFSFYNKALDADGELTLPSTGHYDSAITISNLAGTDLADAYVPNSGWTFDIISDGTFTAKLLGYCTGDGSFSHIDPMKAELAVTVTFEPSCAPLVGTYTGLAWPAEGGTELNVAVYNGFDPIDSNAIGWKIQTP